MSSMLRRMQKKIAKGMGYYRCPMTGKIRNSAHEIVGQHWPKVHAPTREVKKGNPDVASG